MANYKKELELETEEFNKLDQKYKKLSADMEAKKVNGEYNPYDYTVDALLQERNNVERDMKIVKARVDRAKKNLELYKFSLIPISSMANGKQLIKRFKDKDTSEKFSKILKLCKTDEDLENLFSLKFKEEVDEY